MLAARATRGRGASVGTKLAIVTTTLMALVSVGVYFALSSSLERTLLAAKGDSALAVSSLFAANVSAAVDFDDADGIKESFKNLATNEDVNFAAIWSEPATGASAEDGATFKGRYVRPGHAGSARVVRSRTPHLAWGTETLALSMPVLGDGKRVIAHALVEFSLRSERDKIAATKRRVLSTSLAVAAALVVLLLVASRRTVLLPLQRLKASARRIEQGEAGNFDAFGDDEVGELASALGQMANAVHEREAEIRQRNRDMRLVMDNVGQGFLRLSRTAVVAGEYSHVVEEWFGKPAPGVTFDGYLSQLDPKFANNFQVAFEQLTDGFMPPEVALDQAPTRLGAGGKTWNVEYRLLTSDDELEGLIVVITDVTVLLAKERAELAQREIIAASTRVTRDPQGFAEFLKEAESLVEVVTGPDDGAAAPTDDMAVVARSLHTLKGICGTMEAHTVAGLCHELEESLLNDHGGLSLAQKQQLRSQWHGYTISIQPVVATLDGKGIVINQQRYQTFVAQLEAGRPRAELVEEARAWALDDARRPLERLAQSARELAHRLGKGDVRIDVQSSNLRLPRGAFPGLWASLVHVVRNAVDHGLERPEERESLGKPATGRLSISAFVEGDAFLITVSDDGRGIDWPAVAERARALGLPHTTVADLEKALLEPGLTTRRDATETSGRGIGTSALAETVRSLHGQIEVESKRGEGTTFRVRLPRARILEHAAS
jgi:signal transduction histidine kinase/HAMP domain-containing protein